jgi:1-acyl-sn-glycerol-3-phosphate acyltransferase
MNLSQHLVLWALNVATRALCKIDSRELDKIPQHGPLLVLSNHINFLEVPVMRVRLHPRRAGGFAKAEAWQSWWLGRMYDVFEAIPLRRGQIDRDALQQAVKLLESGMILGVAPEGTRSGDGKLQQGKSGIVIIAHMSGAPFIPAVCYGHTNYRDYWSRLRRVPFNIAVGRPFKLRSDVQMTRSVRKAMTEEIMYQMAALLPPENRGVYSDLSRATTLYLDFDVEL